MAPSFYKHLSSAVRYGGKHLYLCRLRDLNLRPNTTYMNSKNNKETHYNKTDKSAKSGEGKAGKSTRTKKPLSAEREKDKTKREFKARGQEFAKREDKPFRKDGDRPFGKRKEEEDRPFKRREDGDKPSFKPRREEGDRPAIRGEGDRPFKRREDGDKPFSRPRREEGDRPAARGEGDRPFKRREDGDKPAFKPRREEGDRPAARGEGDRPFKRREDGDKPFSKPRREEGDRPKRAFNKEGGSESKKPFAKRDSKGGAAKLAAEKPVRNFIDQEFYEDERPFLKSGKWNEAAKSGPMTLNKYLAHSGISSRRETAAIVKDGKVMVNGKVVLEPGYRVQPNDRVTIGDKVMEPQKQLVYILLNKPKDFITTTDDEKGRRTVMDLVANAGVERLFAIGRLDRNTTGVLLITNDGDLTQKLSHPSYTTRKIYQVNLDKDLTKKDFESIVAGLELEDGVAEVDHLAYLEKKTEIGIEIHSGKNRIVRRIFESLGYEVIKLDRVVFAGLTKKNVSRGKWRFLTEKEVITLKHFRP